VRRLSSQFSLGKVTSLITPVQPEWIETHTNMLYCTDMYPATVPFRTCEHCVRPAAAAWLRCPLLLPSRPPVVLPATTADGGAATAARQHAHLHAASMAPVQRAVPLPAATAAVSTTAPVGADAREASVRVSFPAAPSPAPALRGNAAPQRGVCEAAATAPGSPFPASACWAATPRSGPGMFNPFLVPRWGRRRCSNPRRLGRRHCRRR